MNNLSIQRARYMSEQSQILLPRTGETTTSVHQRPNSKKDVLARVHTANNRWEGKPTTTLVVMSHLSAPTPLKTALDAPAQGEAVSTERTVWPPQLKAICLTWRGDLLLTRSRSWRMSSSDREDWILTLKSKSSSLRRLKAISSLRRCRQSVRSCRRRLSSWMKISKNLKLSGANRKNSLKAWKEIYFSTSRRWREKRAQSLIVKLKGPLVISLTLSRLLPQPGMQHLDMAGKSRKYVWNLHLKSLLKKVKKVD